MTNGKPQPITLWLAGSTQHIIECTRELLDDPEFDIQAVIVPQPRAIGRDRTVTAKPLHQLALAKKWPVVLVDDKIDQTIKSQIEELTKRLARPDFLLVVDFGYLIPAWLRQLPQEAPVNLHPSALPRWRGASPGQFVLLSGENRSALTVIRLEAGLDQGAIYTQIEFDVKSAWTSDEYYNYCFRLSAQFLPSVLKKITAGLVPDPQPVESPTIQARKLTKQDGFISWPVLTQILSGHKPDLALLPPLWREVWSDQALRMADWNQILGRYIAALTPWPGVWTRLPTLDGERVMKILTIKKVDQHLELDRVQLAGQQSALWNQVKNVWVKN